MIKIIFLFFFFFSFCFSNVILRSSSSFYPNETFIFTYEVKGEDITFADIKKISSYDVQNAGTSNSYSNYNGTVTRKIIKKFVIYPKEDFIIPSFEFIIDGKTYYSQKKVIKKAKIEKTKSSNFELSMQISKKDLYVGEDAIFTIIFKYKKNLQIVDLALNTPKFDNFWFEQLENNEQYEENGFIVQQLNFLVFPQKEGELIIPALKVDLKLTSSAQNTFSFFASELKTISIYSNELKVNAKKLPLNTTLFGDFEVKASINKNEINDKEAVSYKIEILGFGNIDDLDDIKLDIQNTTIYENKSKTEKSFKNGKYYGTYTKTFSILSLEDFIIPSYELKYFDKKTKTVKTKKTKAFKIKVNSNKTQNIAVLQKSTKELENIKETIKIEEKIIYKTNPNAYILNLIFFFLGIVLTILIFGLYKYAKLKNVKVEDLPLYTRLKKSSNKNDLLKNLAFCLDKDSLLDDKIYELEKMQKDDFILIKKEILKIIKSLIKKGSL